MNPSHDRVERIAQLVRYGGEKFLFHTARTFGFFQRLMLGIDVSGRDDPSAFSTPTNVMDYFITLSIRNG